MTLPTHLSGDLLDDQRELTLAEVCRISGLHAEEITILVEEGVIEPVGPGGGRWRFRATCVRRLRSAVRLHQDLGVNWAGAALALDLLEEVEQLRGRLRRLERGW